MKRGREAKVMQIMNSEWISWSLCAGMRATFQVVAEDSAAPSNMRRRSCRPRDNRDRQPRSHHIICGHKWTLSVVRPRTLQATPSNELTPTVFIKVWTAGQADYVPKQASIGNTISRPYRLHFSDANTR